MALAAQNDVGGIELGNPVKRNGGIRFDEDLQIRSKSAEGCTKLAWAGTPTIDGVVD